MEDGVVWLSRPGRITCPWEYESYVPPISKISISDQIAAQQEKMGLIREMARQDAVEYVKRSAKAAVMEEEYRKRQEELQAEKIVVDPEEEKRRLEQEEKLKAWEQAVALKKTVEKDPALEEKKKKQEQVALQRIAQWEASRRAKAGEVSKVDDLLDEVKHERNVWMMEKSYKDPDPNVVQIADDEKDKSEGTGSEVEEHFDTVPLESLMVDLVPEKFDTVPPIAAVPQSYESISTSDYDFSEKDSDETVEKVEKKSEPPAVPPISNAVSESPLTVPKVHKGSPSVWQEKSKTAIISPRKSMVVTTENESTVRNESKDRKSMAFDFKGEPKDPKFDVKNSLASKTLPNGIIGSKASSSVVKSQIAEVETRISKRPEIAVGAVKPSDGKRDSVKAVLEAAQQERKEAAKEMEKLKEQRKRKEKSTLLLESGEKDKDGEKDRGGDGDRSRHRRKGGKETNVEIIELSESSGEDTTPRRRRSRHVSKTKEAEFQKKTSTSKENIPVVRRTDAEKEKQKPAAFLKKETGRVGNLSDYLKSSRSNSLSALKEVSKAWPVGFIDIEGCFHVVENIRNSTSDEDWALFGYAKGHLHTIELIDSGTGGLAKMKQSVNSEDVSFGFLRMDEKFVGFTFVSRKISADAKLRVSEHKPFVLVFFGPLVTEFQGSKHEMDVPGVMKAVSKAVKDTPSSAASTVSAPSSKALSSDRSNSSKPSVALQTYATTTSLLSRAGGSVAQRQIGRIQAANQTFEKDKEKVAVGSSSRNRDGTLASKNRDANPVPPPFTKALSGSLDKGVQFEDKESLLRDISHLRRGRGDITWVVFSFSEDSTKSRQSQLTLSRTASGSGDPVTGILEVLPSDRAGYCLLRVLSKTKEKDKDKSKEKDSEKDRSRLILVSWIPENIQGVLRGKIKAVQTIVSEFVGHYHLLIHAETRADISSLK